MRCRGVRDFGVNQIAVIAKNSVDVTSDKTAVRFCAQFVLYRGLVTFFYTSKRK